MVNDCCLRGAAVAGADASSHLHRFQDERLMSVKLVVEKSEGQTGRHVVSITAEETVVGRHRECGLRIPCAEVSRRHCILRLRDGMLLLEDLGSLNGVYVNGDRVVGTQTLQPGDRLEIGPVLFSVLYDEAGIPVGIPIAVGAEASASESATVDIKPTDTGIIEGGQPALEVVNVEPVVEMPQPARSDAFTRLER
jgi:pSer/pThr/pTyr-binding forkhead associated (FHA) protein